MSTAQRAKGALGAGMIATALLLLLAMASSLRAGVAPWESPSASAACGIPVLAWLLAAGVVLLRRLLATGGPVLAVSRVVVEEGVRRRTGVACGGLLLVAIALLPLALDRGALLEYRIQSYLTYTLALATFVLSVMTIFLACGTLSGEIRDRQIHSVMAKPVPRGLYLLGKWLGIVLLDLLLLLVAGVGIHIFTTLQVRQGVAAGEDAEVLREGVLIARDSIAPEPEEAFEARVTQMVDRARRESPGQISEDEQRLQARRELERQWRSIEPGGREVYLFHDLDRGDPARGDPVLRLRGHMWRRSRSDRVRLDLLLNGVPRPIFLSPDEFFTVPLPAELRGEGRLRLEIVNPDVEEGESTVTGTVAFPQGDGLEVLVPVGGFTGNLARALIITAIKLGFLAALGLMAAGFLGLPVATLLVMLVAVSAGLGDYILPSADALHSHSRGAEADAAPLRWLEILGVKVILLLERYGSYSPGGLLIDGRLIAWGEVGSCLAWIGLLWSG
ncbi:MAG: ABC transporter permease subunit, partial [Planctomycetota bacterium]